MEANKQLAEEALDFKGVKERLQQIAEAVDDPELSLDDALDLYEEAVALGLQASDLLEVGITEEEAQAAAADAQPEAPASDSDAAEPGDKTGEAASGEAGTGGEAGVRNPRSEARSANAGLPAGAGLPGSGQSEEQAE